MEGKLWELLATSGPVAMVLGAGLYLIGRWGLKQQMEKDRLQVKLTETVERLKQEKENAVEELYAELKRLLKGDDQ